MMFLCPACQYITSLPNPPRQVHPQWAWIVAVCSNSHKCCTEKIESVGMNEENGVLLIWQAENKLTWLPWKSSMATINVREVASFFSAISMYLCKCWQWKRNTQVSMIYKLILLPLCWPNNELTCFPWESLVSSVAEKVSAFSDLKIPCCIESGSNVATRKQMWWGVLAWHSTALGRKEKVIHGKGD